MDVQQEKSFQFSLVDLLTLIAFSAWISVLVQYDPTGFSISFGQLLYLLTIIVLAIGWWRAHRRAARAEWRASQALRALADDLPGAEEQPDASRP